MGGGSTTQVFLSELEERQRVSRLYVDTIGDVVRRHIRGLDPYRGYCVNQSNAARTLLELKLADPALRATLDVCSFYPSICQGMKADDVAKDAPREEPRAGALSPRANAAPHALPAAHLPGAHPRPSCFPLSARSRLFQILRYTEPDHPDQNTLSSALENAEAMLSVVNESIRSREDEEKLQFLTENLIFAGVDAVRSHLVAIPGARADARGGMQRLELTAPTKLLGRRRILKEGQLAKAKSGRKLNAFLFNDLLLFTETKAVAVPIEVVYRWVRPPCILPH